MLCCPLAQHARIFLERGVGCHGNKRKHSEELVAGRKKVSSTLLCCYCCWLYIYFILKSQIYYIPAQDKFSRWEMVQLHVRRGDESQFLFSTTVDVSIETLTQQVSAIYNGRLKVDRICSGMTMMLCMLITFFGFYWFMFFDRRVHTLKCMYDSVSGSYINGDKCKNKCETFDCILSHSKLVSLLFFVSIEIPELADHGVSLPPNMQGLTNDQIMELKLKDEWEDCCIPSGGAEFKKDELGRRNGHGSPVTFKVYI